MLCCMCLRGLHGEYVRTVTFWTLDFRLDTWREVRDFLAQKFSEECPASPKSIPDFCCFLQRSAPW